MSVGVFGQICVRDFEEQRQIEARLEFPRRRGEVTPAARGERQAAWNVRLVVAPTLERACDRERAVREQRSGRAVLGERQRNAEPTEPAQRAAVTHVGCLAVRYEQRRITPSQLVDVRARGLLDADECARYREANLH